MYLESRQAKAYRTKSISDTGIVFKQNQNYFLLADGDAAGAVAGAVLAAGDGCCVGDGLGVATGADSGFDCKTERDPVNVGNDSINAVSGSTRH